jgi:hypothetical protein
VENIIDEATEESNIRKIKRRDSSRQRRASCLAQNDKQGYYCGKHYCHSEGAKRLKNLCSEESKYMKSPNVIPAQAGIHSNAFVNPFFTHN